LSGKSGEKLVTWKRAEGFIKFFSVLQHCSLAKITKRNEKRLGWQRHRGGKAEALQTQSDRKNSIVASEEAENCLCVKNFRPQNVGGKSLERFESAESVLHEDGAEIPPRDSSLCVLTHLPPRRLPATAQLINKQF
jgi:hypothetical protein